MFASTTSVDLDPAIVEKAKKHCKLHGMRLGHFIEEAIIEKIIKGDINKDE